MEFAFLVILFVCFPQDGYSQDTLYQSSRQVSGCGYSSMPLVGDSQYFAFVDVE